LVDEELIPDFAVGASASCSGERQGADSASTAEFGIIACEQASYFLPGAGLSGAPVSMAWLGQGSSYG
jgi:hypothetical protein